MSTTPSGGPDLHYLVACVVRSIANLSKHAMTRKIAEHKTIISRKIVTSALNWVIIRPYIDADMNMGC